MAVRRTPTARPVAGESVPVTGATGAAAGQLIKQLRLARGMTLAELAQVSGLTKGYLSKLERAGKPPPFTTLNTLAQALGVEIDALLGSAADRSAGSAAAAMPPRDGRGRPGSPAELAERTRTVSRNLDLHRARDGRLRFMQGDSYTYLPLVRQYRGKYMTPFLMKLPPGKSRSFTHDSEEFTLVLEGRVKLIYEKKTYQLETGDAFYLDSRIEHTFFNPGKREVLMVSVSFNYRRF